MKKIPQSDLVPGDVVVLTKGITYADMVVITANNVLVDESALTVSFNLRIYVYIYCFRQVTNQIVLRVK